MLAGQALATRLDGEELRDALGERNEVGAVVDHDEIDRSQTGTGGCHVLVRQRGGELRRSNTAFAVPDTAAIRV